MSLSQKFSGLVLVPWFNKVEWDFVYECAYSKDPGKQTTALNLLKQWKLRTPILSTGVEGTLILLEALLLDTANLSPERVAHLYAIALMRFLNLSAANSDKQGSFTQTSTKNELPKWLINLRHDIAHGHQVPSVFNLKMGLDFGFQWLYEKYWQAQSDIIKDYHIKKTQLNQDISFCLDGIVELTVALLENRRLDRVYIDSISSLVNNKLEKSTCEPAELLEFLLEMLEQRLKEDALPDNCFTKLVSCKALLRSEFVEVVENEDGMEKYKIQVDFKNVWTELLNVLHQCGLLFGVIEKLIEVLSDITMTKETHKMAALWTEELFCALLHLKGKEVHEDVIQLRESEFSYQDKLEHFGDKILSDPNPYISYFLDSFLAYSDNSTLNKTDIQKLLKASVKVDTLHQAVEMIHLSDDLPLEPTVNSDEDKIMDSDDVSVNNECANNKSLEYSYSTSKWQKIQDTTAFLNCPLGVLPHQLGLKHPFIKSV